MAAEPFHDTKLVDAYLALYADRANTSVADLDAATKSLTWSLSAAQGYIAPSWNEYPILFQTPDGKFGDGYWKTWALPNDSYTSGTYFCRSLDAGRSSRFSATVNVDQLSTFVYQTYMNGDNTLLEVYVDGVKTRSFEYRQINESFSYAGDNRFFETLEPGTHTITWVYTNNNTNNQFKLKNIGCVATPQISVSLLEPGSLGTEVLYQTDHIKNVRRLKVKGKMNDDDWAKIQMMTELFELDLSEAEADYVPESQFDGSQEGKVAPFLRKVVLPEGMTTIRPYAFRCTHLEDITFPSTLTTIGKEAFYRSSIRQAILPDGFQSLGEYAFYYNRQMTTLDLGESITSIPAYAFDYDHYLKTVNLPNTINSIGDNAFAGCWRMQPATMPTSLKTIGRYAFEYCSDLNPSVLIPAGVTSISDYAFRGCNALESVVVPRSVTSIEDHAFYGCSNLKYAELSVSQYKLTDNSGQYKLFYDCPKLETLRLNSATVVEVDHRNDSEYGPVNPGRRGDIKLVVPEYLVNSYKLDSYWYNFKTIEGFDTSEIQDWAINGTLVMDAHGRMKGTPNVTVGGHNTYSSWKINGDANQYINNLFIGGYHQTHRNSSMNRWEYTNYPGQVWANSDAVEVSGDVTVSLYTVAKEWYFFSLPFDMKISEITHGAANVQYAIRHYDGASRALYGKTGNWVNYDKDNDVIPAGTGFIMQTNVGTWNYFKAVDNEMKQNIVGNDEFVTTLALNASENKSHQGWNLVGNPYQCHYNDHMLNFTAPITVWDTYNATYTAYSLVDDDYAIRPNEAFFVQCPGTEMQTLSFPVQGKQLTDVIDSQNAAPALRGVSETASRYLIDLTLTLGDKGDRTRVVLNEQASLDYEMTCDAGKMMSMSEDVPQLFSLDAAGNAYAINERPEADGRVLLGFFAPQDGTCTIELVRNTAESVYLLDNTTGEYTDLTQQSYTFEAAKGCHLGRFSLSVQGGATVIDAAELDELEEADLYTLSGVKVEGKPEAGVYLLRQGDKSQKVVIK